MVHGYNTRFQLKKAAESKQVAESKQATNARWSAFNTDGRHLFEGVFQPHRPTEVSNPAEASKPAEKAPEHGESLCEQIKAALDDDHERMEEVRVIKLLMTDSSCCRFHRITSAMKLFHYLEHHHRVLKHSTKFKDTTLLKIAEFGENEKQEQAKLDEMVCLCNERDKYKEQCRIVTAMNILMESCRRVRDIIQTFPTS